MDVHIHCASLSLISENGGLVRRLRERTPSACKPLHALNPVPFPLRAGMQAGCTPSRSS